MTEPIFTGFHHFGVITGDLDRALATWTERYGVGPWELRTYTADQVDARVDGEPASFGVRLALAKLGAHAFVELIQPLDEDGPYAASLARHDGADHLHHLRLEVEDFDRSREALAALGAPRLIDASFAGARPGVRSQAIYFDLQDDLGLIAEIAGIPEGFERLPADATVPATTEPLFSGFNHFCVVTSDIERAAPVWSERFGIGPWTLLRMEPGQSEMEVDGEMKSFGARIGLTQLGPHARIELMQPLGDEGPYAESLARHGGADHLHHLRLDIADYDRAREGLEGLGLGKVMEGKATSGAKAGVEAVYFDTTDDLGFIAEIVRQPPAA